MVLKIYIYTPAKNIIISVKSSLRVIYFTRYFTSISNGTILFSVHYKRVASINKTISLNLLGEVQCLGQVKKSR